MSSLECLINIENLVSATGKETLTMNVFQISISVIITVRLLWELLMLLTASSVGLVQDKCF